jgi:NAD(P)H-hydrate epimerase
MRYAVNAREMKLIDDYSIQTVKIPQAELMERAAGEVVAVMLEHIKKSDRILVVSGPGNNGGDGIAAGRILYLQGYSVAILFIGDEEKASEGLRIQLEIARNLGIPNENPDKLHEYNIIIDAIFGVGLVRPVTGRFEELIHRINAADNKVFSVDIPSGISADNGRIMNAAIAADYTITFGYQKLGLILYPGADCAGVIKVADIGFPETAALQVKPEFIYYEAEDLYRLPPRKNYSNKGTYGKVLVIGGSKGMSGAVYLSAKAAYRTGAGLVKILTAQDNRIILQTSLPEALFAAYDEQDAGEKAWEQGILKELAWADVIVIGPGLGRSQTARKLLWTVLSNVKIPVIVDADGITMLAEELNSGSGATDKRLERIASLFGQTMILTPHLGELSRFINVQASDIADNLVDTVRQCSYNNNLIYAIKDARTLVVQGEKKYINVSGNNGMATGGSGDVLTGIIAALLAQGAAPYMAVCLAVYLHGLAGDKAAQEKGMYSMMAGDIVASIEKVLKPVEHMSTEPE